MNARPTRTYRVALAAGGTAGHVYPAIAVAQEMQARQWSVVFLGTHAGREAEILAAHGFEPRLLPGFPYQRQGAAGRLRALTTIPLAVGTAARVLHWERVEAVIGFGGYAAVGPVIAARGSGRFAAIVDGNAQLGQANRLLLRFVHRIYVGYGTEVLRGDSRVRRVGMPIRREVAADAQGSPARSGAASASLLVMGDSFLDARVPALVDALVKAGFPLRVVHQSANPPAYPGGIAATRVRELPDVGQAYREADLVICRAGASTLAELAACGRAALVVPLRAAAEDHQTLNARAWQREGAAMVVAEDEWSSDTISRRLGALLADPMALRRLERRAQSFALPDAARDLVDDLEAALDRRNARSASEDDDTSNRREASASLKERNDEAGVDDARLRNRE